MATRRALPGSACRWCPTAFPISPARWPACWPVSTGPRRNGPDCPFVVSVATDAPFLPRDLVARFTAAIEAAQADLACAASGGQAHPVIGLWPVRLREDLRHAVVEEGIRKVDAWTARHRLATVTFASEPVDPFFNANRPEDLAAAAALLDLSETK